VRVALFGYQGKVGSVLAPALEAAGHEVRGIGPGEEADLAGLDAALDFTQPDAAGANVRAALERGVPAVVGTTDSPAPSWKSSTRWPFRRWASRSSVALALL
jgi:4-hydroxy-tetrahydrodipicolinate reductase